jgi:hypothetical protein
LQPSTVFRKAEEKKLVKLTLWRHYSAFRIRSMARTTFSRELKAESRI